MSISPLVPKGQQANIAPQETSINLNAKIAMIALSTIAMVAAAIVAPPTVNLSLLILVPLVAILILSTEESQKTKETVVIRTPIIHDTRPTIPEPWTYWFPHRPVYLLPKVELPTPPLTPRSVVRPPNHAEREEVGRR